MQAWCKQLVESTGFTAFILLLILAAAVVVGLDTYPEIHDSHGHLLETIDWIIIWLFVAEAVLKMAAHGAQPWRYFNDPWNVFDFTIVVVCFLPLGGQYAAVMRLARVIRALRLVSVVPRLQLLVGALLKSVSSLVWVGLLLFVLFYIYAVLGVYMWGPGDPAHFGTLDRALLTLFSVITLEGWTDLMDLQMQRDVDFAGMTMPASISAPIYFITFILLGTMIMLNLFIGVIINSMEEVEAEEERKQRARHLAETGKTTIVDDINQLDDQLDEMKRQLDLVLSRVREETDEAGARRKSRQVSADAPPPPPAGPAGDLSPGADS